MEHCGGPNFGATGIEFEEGKIALPADPTGEAANRPSA